jgi:hypothetical protein
MHGIRLLNESTYYWVWSSHGPSDNGTYYGRTFVNGMVPCPMPGDIAQEFESFGFTIEEFVADTWFSHWEKEPNHGYRQRPIFKSIASQKFPPDELPERLPDTWQMFFGKYTNGGKLRKEFRKIPETDLDVEDYNGC